jgi:ketosteroid isomerase-like protein
MNLDWIKELFSSIDAMDLEKFVSFINDDGVFVFGNAPDVKGKENITQAVDGFFKSIKALVHSDLQWGQDGDKVFSRGICTYTRHNETKIAIPFCNIFEMKNNKIQHYQIYIDITQLYS